MAKVVMPVGAVKAVASGFWDFIVVKKHDVRNIREIVVGV